MKHYKIRVSPCGEWTALEREITHVKDYNDISVELYFIIIGAWDMKIEESVLNL